MMEIPEGTTHIDLHPLTECRCHKQINGQWAYNRGFDDWKVYDNQSDATTDFFVPIGQYQEETYDV